MSARLRAIARQTEEIVAAGGYRTPDGRTVSLADDLAASLAGTRLHGPAPVPVTPDTDRTPAVADRLPAALASRAERVLETAAAHGCRRLVLGAWGCGVFQNDPRQVAGAFAALLTGDGRFAGHFEEIVFALLDRAPGTPTPTAFTRVIGAATA
ncbi:TIGR02452 family protein [Streptomyces sp. SID6041]|nr:TIGR02452 family protein [Streptomyces sp. SID6041]